GAAGCASAASSAAGTSSSWARHGSAARPSRSPAVNAKAGRVRLRHGGVDRATKDLAVLGVTRTTALAHAAPNAPNHNAFARLFGAKLRLGPGANNSGPRPRRGR